MNPFKRTIATAALIATGVSAGIAMAPSAGAAPADGRCVAQGAGATFDGPTKAAVARAGLMSFAILDHAFNGADEVEGLFEVSICE
jgi:hypothetical protein